MVGENGKTPKSKTIRSSAPDINNESYCDVKAMLPASAIRHAPLPRLFKAVEQSFRDKCLMMMRAEGIDGLFPGATPLILHLGEADGLTISELARRCGLENSTMTPLLDELEKRRLAERVRDPEDRRAMRLHLTPEGKDMEPRLRGLLMRLQNAAFEGVPESDIEVMKRVMEKIVLNLESMREK
jgi:DNA-binding MarR family transcriptional regulator